MAGSIHTRRWHPDTGAQIRRRGVYMMHGIGEHSGRYERLANRLTKLGFEVGAHDHPGHGASTGKRGVIESGNHLELCAIEQLDTFASETGASPYLFGHSLGGLVATSMVINHHAQVAGLILSAPAYSPFITPYNRLKLTVMNVLAPKFAMQLPYHAENLTHDEVEQELGRNDPLNHKYKSASIVMWLLETGKLMVELAGRLAVPTLVLIPGDDPVINSEFTHQFIENANRSLITQHDYPGFKHEALNETSERREQVMDDIERWLLKEEG